MKKSIYEKLKKFYKISILPAIIFFVYVQFADLNLKNFIKDSKYINFIFVGCSILFALVLPIIIRIANFFKVNDKGAMTEKRFVNFERILIIISQLSIYILIIGQQVLDSRIIMIILSVIAFYALFYYYPTERKINMDMRIFMLKR